MLKVSPAKARIGKALLVLSLSFFSLLPALQSSAALEAPVLQPAAAYCSGSSPFVTLIWTTVADAVSYEIYKDGVLANTVAATTYDDLAVSPLENHSYFIKARSSGGEVSPPSNSENIVVPRCGPVLTLGARSCLADGPKIDLSWNALADVSGYEIYRDGSQLGQVSAGETAYADVTAAGAGSYNYVVRAVWTGETKDSNSLAVDALSCSPLLSANGNCDAPGAESTLTWPALRGATEYRVFKEGSFLASLAGTSFSDQAISQLSSYNYFLRAVYGAGGAADSNNVNVSIPRCPPVLAAQNTCNPTNPLLPEIKLTWTSTASATLYDVFEAVRGFLAQVASPAASYTDGLTEADNGRTFNYRVEAKGTFGTLASNQAQATADCSLGAVPSPAPVLNVTPICSAGDSQMSLSWTPSDNILNYTVERKNNSTGETYLRDVPASDTSFVDPNIEVGVSYSYKIIAVGNGGSTPSNSVTKTSADCTPPSTPTLASPAAFCSSGRPGVNLFWTRSSNAAKYEIYRDGAKIDEIADPATTYTDSAVANSTAYSYEIRAVGPGGTASSGPKSVATQNCTPPTSPNLALGAPVCAGTNVSMPLSWTASVNANYYDIYRKKTSAASFGPPIRSAYAGTSYTDTGLTQNESYDYYVMAVGPGGSTPSNMATRSTPYCPPGTPGITATTALCSFGLSAIKIDWSDTINTASYEVRRIDNTLVGTVIYPVRTITDNGGGAGLNPGSSYSYTVKAIGNGGSAQSAASAPKTAVSCTGPGKPVVTWTALCSGSNPRIKLDWGATANTVSYDVFRGAVKIATLASSVFTYTDSGPLVANANYTYKIVANGPAGAGSTSSDDVPARTSYCVPSKPALTVTPQCSAGKAVFKLTWTDATPSNTTSYEIRRAGALIATVSPPTLTFTDDNAGAGFNAGETKSYTVTAVGPAGQTASDPKSAQALDCSAPGQPVITELTPQCSVSNPQVKIAWQASSNTQTYEVFRGTTKIATVASTGAPNYSYLDTYSATNIITSNTNYTYKVTAVNAAGGRTESDPQTTTTVWCPPTTPTWWASYPRPTCSGGKSAMQLYWTYAQPYQNTATFEVKRDDGAGFATIATINAGGFGWGFYTDNNGGAGLVSGRNYSYQITGAGPTGLKTNSLVKSATAGNCSVAAPSVPSQCTISFFNPITHVVWSRADFSVSDTVFYIARKRASEAAFIAAYQWLYNYRAASPTTFRDWLILGTFPNNPNPDGLNTDYIADGTGGLSSETAIKPRVGETVSGKTWKRLVVSSNTDYVDLQSASAFGSQDNVAAYAFAYVYAPGAITGELRVGSDDGIKVYVNGVKLLDKPGTRPAVRDNDKISVSLNAGVNTILLKIGEIGGQWGFYARLTDPAGNPLLSTITSSDSAAPANESAEYYVWASPSLITSAVITAPAPSCSPVKPAVSLLPACSGSQTTIMLNWAGTANTNYYHVFRNAVDDLASASQLTSPAAPILYDSGIANYEYKDNALEEDRRYYYWVKAFGNGVTSSDAASDQSLVCATRPDKPVLTPDMVRPACSGTSSRVLLDWPDAANAISYTVHRNEAALTPSVASSAFTDGSVSGGATYAYKIEAKGTGGSSFSDPVTVEAVDCSGPPAPPVLNSANVIPRTTNVFLSWTDKSLNEEGFRVRRSIVVGALKLRSLFAGLLGSFEQFAAVISPDLPPDTVSYTDQTSQENTTYEYSLEAFNGAPGSPVSSNALQVFVPIPPPGSFSLAAACSQGGTDITLDWSPGAGTTPLGGEVAYNAYWAQAEGGPFALLPSPCSADITSTSCTAPAPVRGIKLWYKVTARNNGGTTDALASQSCALPPPKFREILPPF